MRRQDLLYGALVFALAALLVGCASVSDLAKSNPKSTIALPSRTKIAMASDSMLQANSARRQESVVTTKTETAGGVPSLGDNVLSKEFDSLLNEEIGVQHIDAVVISRRSLQNVAERNGKIDLEFVVSVSDSLIDRNWQLVVNPFLWEGRKERVALDPLVYRGDRWSKMQAREYERYGQLQEEHLGDLRRYVLATDGILADNVTYVSDPNDKFDHLTDYFTPRYRYEGVDVIPGDEVYMRVDGECSDPGDRQRENHLQALATTPRSVRKGVKAADGHTVREYAQQRLEWSNFDRPTTMELLMETDTAVINRNLTTSRYYAPGMETFYGTASYQSAVRHPYYPNARLDTVIRSFPKMDREEYLDLKWELKDQELSRREVRTRLDSIARSGNHVDFYYTHTVQANEDTDSLFLYLAGFVENRQGMRYVLRKSDTIKFNVQAMVKFIDTRPRYKKIRQMRDEDVDHKFDFSFRSGRSTLDTTRLNRENVEKVKNLVRSLMTDPVWAIDSITLRATASPEGTYRINERLARERAYTLRDVLIEEFRPIYDSLKAMRLSGSYTLDEKTGKTVLVDEEEEELLDLPNLLKASWIAEDWDMLAEFVRADRGEMADKEEILAMIGDRSVAPDVLEYRIRREYPQGYTYMRKEIYPKMRAVNFRFKLRRKGMKEVFIELDVLDEDYARAMELMKKRRYDDALNILRDYNDRNTAIAYMSAGYDKAAYNVLSSMPGVDDLPEEQYLMAITALRLGDERMAIYHLKRAVELRNSFWNTANLDPELAALKKKYPGLERWYEKDVMGYVW